MVGGGKGTARPRAAAAVHRFFSCVALLHSFPEPCQPPNTLLTRPKSFWTPPKTNLHPYVPLTQESPCGGPVRLQSGEGKTAGELVRSPHPLVLRVNRLRDDLFCDLACLCGLCCYFFTTCQWAGIWVVGQPGAGDRRRPPPPPASFPSICAWRLSLLPPPFPSPPPPPPAADHPGRRGPHPHPVNAGRAACGSAPGSPPPAAWHRRPAHDVTLPCFEVA